MIGAALSRFLRRLGGHLTAGLATRKDIEDLYDLIAGLQQIQLAMAGQTVLKPLRIWVISPDAMAWILADLQERTAPTVVEFGAGQSTVILATCLKHKGAGRLVSFEHDPLHADAIRRQLTLCGVADYVDLRLLPLVEHPAQGSMPAGKTYSLADVEDLSIDLALVDGPPYWCGDAARLAPLAWVAKRLAINGTVYLDDTARPAERRVLAEVVAQVPGLTVEDLRAEKGLARCTRAAAAPPGKPQ